MIECGTFGRLWPGVVSRQLVGFYRPLLPHIWEAPRGNSPLPEKTVELHRDRATMFGLYQWRVKTPKSENTSSRSGTQAGALWFSITQWRAIWEGRLLDTQLERGLGRKALGFLWFWAACLGLPVTDALKDPVTPSPLSEVSLFPVSIIFQEKKWNVTSLKMLPEKKEIVPQNYCLNEFSCLEKFC